MATFGKHLLNGGLCGRLKPLVARTAVINNSYSSSCSVRNDKVYELRTYYMYPQHVKNFMELARKWIHVRSGVSKMVGFWTCEIGGINDIIHLWEYDNLAHRAQVRQSLATNDTWSGNFISKILPMVMRQDNSMVMCLPGTDVIQPAQKGVYEIQNFDYGNTDLQTVTTTVQGLSRPEATLLASFYTTIGPLSSGFLLWHHTNVNSFSHPPPKLSESSGIRYGHSRLLTPAPWSPLQ